MAIAEAAARTRHQVVAEAVAEDTIHLPLVAAAAGAADITHRPAEEAAVTGRHRAAETTPAVIVRRPEGVIIVLQ